jgi:hypothetical protein
VVPSGVEPGATNTNIPTGPNTGFVFAAAVADRNYKSEPQIHPDVTNAASAFRVFHQDASRLYFVPNTGPRVLIPLTEYKVLRIAGPSMTFDVPDWAAFYKKHGVVTVTCSFGGNTITAQNNWWTLQPNTQAGAVTLTSPGAVRAALKISERDAFNIAVTVNGNWEAIPLMPSASIPPATRSHEYVHAVHSHRANLHAMVRALDPRRLLESTVSTPSTPVVFGDKIHNLLREIMKPNHELVDEPATKAAGNFVALSGKTMAAINQDPATGGFLGALWDITHDRVVG